MPYFIDNIKKILFITSPKVGYGTLWHIFAKEHGLSHGSKFISETGCMTGDCDLIDFSDYKVFVILRDPFKRIVSAFLHRVIKVGGSSIDKMYEEHNYMSFKEFVRLLLKEHRGEIQSWILSKDWHFHQQSLYCDKLDIDKHCNVKYIDIDELSALTNYYYAITEHVNALDRDLNQKLSMYNCTIDALKNMSHYPSYEFFYDTEIVECITEIYQSDIIYAKDHGIFYNPPKLIDI